MNEIKEEKPKTKRLVIVTGKGTPQEKRKVTNIVMQYVPELNKYVCVSGK